MSFGETVRQGCPEPGKVEFRVPGARKTAKNIRETTEKLVNLLDDCVFGLIP